MDNTDRGVAVMDGIHEDPDAQQIKNFVELMAAHDHLLVDGPVVFRPAHHLSFNAVFTQLSLQRPCDLPQCPVSRWRAVRHKADNLLVFFRVQDGKR